MKIKFNNNFSHNLLFIMRRAGYQLISDKRQGKQSFVRKLTRYRYPRFHLYLKEKNNDIFFDLHLDQTATRYSNQTAHQGDYESDVVKTELTRIYHIVNRFIKK